MNNPKLDLPDNRVVKAKAAPSSLGANLVTV